MKRNKVTYYLDYSAALEESKVSVGNDMVFYYDGEEISDAPVNCINVPTEDFVKYFISTLSKLPEQIDFTNKKFSEEVKNYITQVVCEAIGFVKNELIKVALDAEIDNSNINNISRILLNCIKEASYVNNREYLLVIKKLLEISGFTINNSKYIFDIGIKELVNELLVGINHDVCSDDLKSLHKWYALKLMHSPEKKNDTQDNYFKILAGTQNLEELYNNYELVVTAFPEENLDIYIEKYQKYLFLEDFLQLDIREQKIIICKFVYLTVLHYERSEKFKKIYFILYELYKKSINIKLDELVLWLYSPLLYCWNAVSTTQDEFKKYNEEIEKPLENYIKNIIMPKYEVRPNTIKSNENKGFIRIAFLQERFIDYSIFSVLYSLLKSLSKTTTDEYEFIIYDLNFMELGGSDKSSVDKIKELGFKYIDLHQEYVGNNSHFYSILDKLLKIRERIIDDDVDILIANNGRPETNLLFSTRTAPKQIYWTHGNYVYDLNEIDGKIVHYIAVDNNTNYNFTEFKIIGDYALKNEQESKEKANEVRRRWGDNTIVLGAIGRLIKINSDEYLGIVAELLKGNPNTIYLACGAGNQFEIKEKVEKLGVLDRFYFEGFIDPDVYSLVIDIYLDPFPYGGGESLEKFREISENGYVVSVNVEPIRPLNYGVNTYLMSALTYIRYIEYIKRPNKKPNKLYNDKFVICSDMPANKTEADFITYLLDKYDDMIYAIPRNNVDFIKFFPKIIIDRKIIEIDEDNMFDYALLSDLYLTFYNYIFKYVFLHQNKKIFIQVDSSSVVNTCIREQWNVCDSDSIVAKVVADITNGDKKLFDTAGGRYKAFSLLYGKAGLKGKELEELWCVPNNGIDRAKIDCDLALKYRGYAELILEVDSLYCKYGAEYYKNSTESSSKSILESFLHSIHKL